MKFISPHPPKEISPVHDYVYVCMIKLIFYDVYLTIKDRFAALYMAAEKIPGAVYSAAKDHYIYTAVCSI